MLAGCDTSMRNNAGQTAEEILAALTAQASAQAQLDAYSSEGDKIASDNYESAKVKSISTPKSIQLLRDAKLNFWNCCAFGNRKYQETDFAHALKVNCIEYLFISCS